MEQGGATETTNDENASNMKQEGATGEETNPQSTETDNTTNTNESMEQSSSESSQQGRSGEVQVVDRTWKKFFVHLEGKTNNAHQDFVEKFKSIGQTQANSPERSDYILVFCPIPSNVAEDIRETLENAEKNNPGGKPIILVVMHHTFDPNSIVAESRRLVNNPNVCLTIDCLFYEGELLKCHRNDAAWSEIKKNFVVSEVDTPQTSQRNDQAASVMEQEGATGEETNPQSTETDNTTNTNESMEQSSSESSQQGRSRKVQVVDRPWKKFFVHLAGKTNNAHQDFVKKFKSIGQTEVDSPERSDYILVFCPIVSRVGTDIGEALENAPGGKPIILVVMHHTFNPDHVIAESRRLVNNPNVHLTVDCLIYEGELLKCHRNDAAWSEVQKILEVSELPEVYTPQTSQRNDQAASIKKRVKPTETTNDENASNVKQEGATGEETNPQSTETDNTTNTNEPMEQSPSESSQQGRSGEVQGVDQINNDKAPPDESWEVLPVPWKKFFVHLAGKTNNAHQDFVKKFKRIGQTEVNSPERSDYILVFCPIVSRVGTDIREALESAEKNNPGGKPIILVVMHHTFNPDHVIAESRRLVNSQNVKLTVDCLFYVGELLKCHCNDAAWSEVRKIFGVSEVSNAWLKRPVSIKKGEYSSSAKKTSQRNDQAASDEDWVVATGTRKFFVLLAGKTNNAHQDFVKKFKRIGQTEVDSPERSDYILVFCPIVSRVGMDIGEALESAEKNNPGGKPIILVVMHHTFDPDRVIAESRKLVNNQNVKLTVDCLIYEGELLKCHRNDAAWSEVQKILGVSEVSSTPTSSWYKKLPGPIQRLF